MKDDKIKNIILLKDGPKELIELYPNIFRTFVKNELKELAAKEEEIDYKKFRKIWHALQVFKKFNWKQNKHKYSKWWSKQFCITWWKGTMQAVF